MECEFCFNSGFCMRDHNGNDVPLETSGANRMRGVTQCYNCNYWERYARKMEEKQMEVKLSALRRRR